jgi:hypothetical protein
MLLVMRAEPRNWTPGTSLANSLIDAALNTGLPLSPHTSQVDHQRMETLAESKPSAYGSLAVGFVGPGNAAS